MSDTIRERIGWDGKVAAAYVGRDWSISPAGRLPREEWLAKKRSLRAILPDGARVVDGEGSVTVSYDERGIPSLLSPDGALWVRLGNSDLVERFLADFMGARIEARS